MKRVLLFTICIALWSAARAQTGFWSGSVDINGTKIGLVFDLGEEKLTLDVPSQNAKAIPGEVKRSEGVKLELLIPAIGARFDGLFLGKSIVGTFVQSGISLPLTLKPGGIEIHRPQTPVPPFDYATEEVSLKNGDIELHGTLSLPKAYDRTTPALVMITGSGTQNRDEEIFSHKPFAVIADQLARNGIASLRYDDRDYGNERNAVNTTISDMEEDALAAMKLLRTMFDKIGVLGHSEGGAIALIIASSSKADFAISLAGMVISGQETLLRQNKDALEALGYDSREYCRLLADTFESLCRGKPLPRLADYTLTSVLVQNYKQALVSLDTPYMRSFLTVNVQSLLNDVHCPVMAMNGTKDTQVDCEANLGALKKALTGRADIVPLPGLNHLFQHCATGATSEYNDIEETIAPEALDMMTQWLRSL